jgi:hypothetical protein
MATQAQKMGSVKDIQSHLRHARPDTTANEYMQELPKSVVQMVGAVYEMLMKGGPTKPKEVAGSKAGVARLLPNATNPSEPIPLSCWFDGGHSRIRTYDFHRVKVALYRWVMRPENAGEGQEVPAVTLC